MLRLWGQGDLDRGAACRKRDEPEKRCLVFQRPTRAVPGPSRPAPPGDCAGGGAGGAEPAEGAGPGDPGPALGGLASLPRGNVGTQRLNQPSSMAAHGKLRRERGLQPEYDAQVKGERAL